MGRGRRPFWKPPIYAVSRSRVPTRSRAAMGAWAATRTPAIIFSASSAPLQQGKSKMEAETTEAMLARIRELATPERDDFDRAVNLLLGHFDRLKLAVDQRAYEDRKSTRLNSSH